MIKWGYDLVSGRGINLDGANFKPSDELFACEEALRACIGCGACTAACTAGALTPFNFRQMHTFIRRGELKMAKEEVKKCMLCGKCSMLCPRGINTRNVVVSIKKIFSER